MLQPLFIYKVRIKYLGIIIKSIFYFKVSIHNQIINMFRVVKEKEGYIKFLVKERIKIVKCNLNTLLIRITVIMFCTPFKGSYTYDKIN